MSKRDQLIQKLGAAISDDEGLMEEPWQQLALVVKFDKASTEVRGVAFDGDDDAPVIPEKSGEKSLQGVLGKLREVMAEEDKAKPFVACLVRVARDSGQIDIDFEYKNQERWDYDAGDSADKRAKLLP